MTVQYTNNWYYFQTKITKYFEKLLKPKSEGCQMQLLPTAPLSAVGIFGAMSARPMVLRMKLMLFVLRFTIRPTVNLENQR